MPKSVGMHPLLDAGTHSQPPQESPHVGAVQWTTAESAEKRTGKPKPFSPRKPTHHVRLALPQESGLPLPPALTAPHVDHAGG